jgi:twitching motility two-component system response regulator PilH
MDKLALKDVLARMWKHKEEEPSLAPAGADAAVLIVDDSRTVVRALSLMLEREGYLTLSAADGLQAITLAKFHKPDLILMDIVMPRMNGFEATRILTNDPETKKIPIVMVSGTDQPSDHIWSMRLGAKGFLTKPVSREALLARVRVVLALARRAETRTLPEDSSISVTAVKY